jgi:short-subunit dehydrogenase
MAENAKQKNQKVAVITGASSGIGKALAYEFAKQGYDLSLAARRISLLEAISQNIEEQYHVQVVYFETDVSNEQACKRLIEETIAHFGRIDVLINNAGISQRALFNQLDISDFRRIMDINFWGTVMCTKFALPHLLESKGSVVGVSSISGFSPLPGRTAYCSSKYGMHGFLESLRIENMKLGLHVMIVAPGFTATEIRKKAVVAGGGEQGKSPRNEKGMMSPERVAQKVARGVRIRKRTIIMTPQGIGAVWFSRI